jgi:hypothetical protein
MMIDDDRLVRGENHSRGQGSYPLLTNLAPVWKEGSKGTYQCITARARCQYAILEPEVSMAYTKIVTMRAVNCRKHKRVVPINRVNVKDDPLSCRTCPLFVKATCSQIKCNYAEP